MFLLLLAHQVVMMGKNVHQYSNVQNIYTQTSNSFQ